jgi:hypothetical protein
VPGTRCPDSNSLQRTIANMRSGQVYVNPKGKPRVRFSVIPVDLLKTWNSINGDVDEKVLENLLSVPNPNIV